MELLSEAEREIEKLAKERNIATEAQVKWEKATKILKKKLKESETKTEIVTSQISSQEKVNEELKDKFESVRAKRDRLESDVRDLEQKLENANVSSNDLALKLRIAQDQLDETKSSEQRSIISLAKVWETVSCCCCCCCFLSMKCLFVLTFSIISTHTHRYVQFEQT